jgi:hypothetical protein
MSGDGGGRQQRWPALRYMAGSVEQRVYWARTVVRGLERWSRQAGKFLDRGGEWEERMATCPPGWRFTVWFDAGDVERVGDKVRKRSWPQHRAFYECVADPEARTRISGTGKRQRGFVDGAFRILRGGIGDRAYSVLEDVRSELGNRRGGKPGRAEEDAVPASQSSGEGTR